MNEEENRNNLQKISFSQYFAGASVANAPPFIVNYFMNFFEIEVTLTVIILIYLSALGGSTLGSYLMYRLVRFKDFRNGVIMGFFSFAFHTFLILVSGFICWINDFILLTAFIFGGYLGYKIWERIQISTESIIRIG